ncbi:MAG: CRISPR-associated protein [Eubacteriales bacterium]|nr:CRISPR-associated protein [Eubacteriales bacterium]
MLKECIEIFERQLQDKGMGLILDSYIPADGTYLIVGKDGQCREPVEIRVDKKTKELYCSSQLYFSQICFYDYYSQLVSMNKPVDPKKIIHSNNYMSFWVKKDSILSGKLTNEIIDTYYEILMNPLKRKYAKSKEASRIYQLFEQEEGSVNPEEVEEKKNWIKAHIFQLHEVDMSRKDYLKIFFEGEEDVYEREGRRYFLPNIYNSNEYNVEIENIVYGLPDNNVGMNSKKPFLSIKTRKYPAPYLLDGESVMLQKMFFDYLMNLACKGEYSVYIDTKLGKIYSFSKEDSPEEVESGYYLRIRKGKNEAEILNQDNLVQYQKRLKRDFLFEEIIEIKYCRHPEYERDYRAYDKRTEIGALISRVFFSNYLEGCYFAEASEININNEILKQNILFARNTIFDWVNKGVDRGFAGRINKIARSLIKNSLLYGYRERAIWQLNLMYSFQQYFETEGEENKKGEKNMAETISKFTDIMKQKILASTVIPLANDEEYFFAVGQMASFLISLNKSKDKNQSLINPFLNAGSNEVIKKKILQLYKKYNYAISDNSRRVKNLLAMIEGYELEGEINQEKIILGYACDNIIYKGGKENDE